MNPKASEIFRRSIFTFLKNYHHFTSTPSLLAFPFAISCLVSQSLVPSSSLFPAVLRRVRSLSLAAGFPPSSQLLLILDIKLSQTILTHVFTLPFTLSFLLLARASVIRSLSARKTTDTKHAFHSLIPLLGPLIITQLCNSLLILSANATCFCLVAVYLNVFDVLGALSGPGSTLLVSAAGGVIYSIVLANACVVCNLALLSSGLENRGGFVAILKTCALIRGRNATALSLAVPMNTILAAMEALFQYRVAGAYGHMKPSMVLEGILIAYLYGVMLVVDAITGCIFLKSCISTELQIRDQMDDSHFYSIQIQEDDGK